MIVEVQKGVITLRKAIDDYKNVYMRYRNFADRTRVEYQNDLADFITFIEPKGINHVGELGVPIVERYVAHLEEEGYASLTRKRKVIAIRSFISFLYEDGYIETNIAKRVVLPFTEYPSPNFLTQAECYKLRSACANDPRNTAIIELVLQTGIKLSELVSLTLDDIELSDLENSQGLMRLKGSRGKKERVIPLNTKACVALKSYLDIRKDAETSVLFLNRLGKPLGESGVQKMLTKYLSAASIIGASAHSLRHTFGLHHATKGTSLKTIQEIMGFKDPRSALNYFDLSKTMMSKELQEHAI